MAKRIVNVTLLFCGEWLTNVREETGMGCAALGVVPAGFIEAELAVDSETHIRGVGVFLAVVLPPANRAQDQGAGHFQCLVAAARASVTGVQGFPLRGMDGKTWVWITGAGFSGQVSSGRAVRASSWRR